MNNNNNEYHFSDIPVPVLNDFLESWDDSVKTKLLRTSKFFHPIIQKEKYWECLTKKYLTQTPFNNEAEYKKYFLANIACSDQLEKQFHQVTKNFDLTTYLQAICNCLKSGYDQLVVRVLRYLTMDLGTVIYPLDNKMIAKFYPEEDFDKVNGKYFGRMLTAINQCNNVLIFKTLLSYIQPDQIYKYHLHNFMTHAVRNHQTQLGLECFDFFVEKFSITTTDLNLYFPICYEAAVLQNDNAMQAAILKCCASNHYTPINSADISDEIFNDLVEKVNELSMVISVNSSVSSGQ